MERPLQSLSSFSLKKYSFYVRQPNPVRTNFNGFRFLGVPTFIFHSFSLVSFSCSWLFTNVEFFFHHFFTLSPMKHGSFLVQRSERSPKSPEGSASASFEWTERRALRHLCGRLRWDFRETEVERQLSCALETLLGFFLNMLGTNYPNDS